MSSELRSESSRMKLVHSLWRPSRPKPMRLQNKPRSPVSRGGGPRPDPGNLRPRRLAAEQDVAPKKARAAIVQYKETPGFKFDLEKIGPFDVAPEILLANELFDLIPEVVAYICVMTVISMESIILHPDSELLGTLHGVGRSQESFLFDMEENLESSLGGMTTASGRMALVAQKTFLGTSEASLRISRCRVSYGLRTFLPLAPRQLYIGWCIGASSGRSWVVSDLGWLEGAGHASEISYSGGSSSPGWLFGWVTVFPDRLISVGGSDDACICLGSEMERSHPEREGRGPTPRGRGLGLQREYLLVGAPWGWLDVGILATSVPPSSAKNVVVLYTEGEVSSSAWSTSSVQAGPHNSNVSGRTFNWQMASLLGPRVVFLSSGWRSTPPPCDRVLQKRLELSRGSFRLGLSDDEVSPQTQLSQRSRVVVFFVFFTLFIKVAFIPLTEGVTVQGCLMIVDVAVCRY
ncbi:hypothetical protein BHM03_00030054 [Ensete ventricosum]|nr:hypothetical protein BHM03_00030054 [Ensete ventricosum]